MSELDDKLLELAHEIYNGQPALKALEEVRRLTVEATRNAAKSACCGSPHISVDVVNDLYARIDWATEHLLPQVRAEEKP